MFVIKLLMLFTVIFRRSFPLFAMFSIDNENGHCCSVNVEVNVRSLMNVKGFRKCRRGPVRKTMGLKSFARAE